jgi:putative glycosyl hydrolase
MNRRALTLGIAGALVIASTRPVVVAERPREGFGVVTSIQFLQNNPPEIGLQKLQELGAGAVRVSLHWNLLQPRANGPFNFTGFDNFLLNARASGMQIYANLGDPPDWAAACETCMPSLISWYIYVRVVLQHYASLGTTITYGIWNEPNDSKFLKLTPADPDSRRTDPYYYSVLSYYAMLARNHSGTRARFAVPETTPAAWENGWFQQFQQYIAPYIATQDIIAVHWYPKSRDLRDYLSLIAGYTQREVWLTEWGPLTPTDDASQVRTITEVLDLFAHRDTSLSNWTRQFYYRLYDGQCCTETLLLPDWSNRPGFNTYKSYVLTRNGEVAFFDDADFGGASFTAAAGGIPSLGGDRNDRITSIRVPPGRTLSVFEHANYAGASASFTSGGFDLRDYTGPGPGGTWNDAISSVWIQ